MLRIASQNATSRAIRFDASIVARRFEERQPTNNFRSDENLTATRVHRQTFALRSGAHIGPKEKNIAGHVVPPARDSDFRCGWRAGGRAWNVLAVGAGDGATSYREARDVC